MLSVSLVHCKKDNNDGQITISGIVKDARSGEAIYGISIEFLIQGIVNGSFNNNYRIITEDISDSEGRYSITFEEGIPSSFRFELEGEGYYFSRQDFNPDDFTSSGENNLDLLIDSRAWLKLRIVNEGTVNNGDQVTLALSTENNACTGCCQSIVLQHSGQTNVTNICEAFGNSNASVEGIINDAIFGQSDYFDEIMLAPRDTTELLISF